MKALIAMSGGVDSSVAAFLTKKMGYDCIGVTMKLYDNENIGIKSKTCCSLSDIEDARSVSIKMNMPYYVFNFKDDFEKNVIARFVSAYENGYTPNPCIDCNRYLKFNSLYKRAKEIGCEKIVTGHYAIIEQNQNGRWILKKAKDTSKDQSYVLYSLTQEQLAHTLLPCGEYIKEDIRKIADDNGFLNSRKKDSQDICFVPDGDYASFIEKHTNKKYDAGNFVDTNGNTLGTHKGIIHYTIGQRKGLGIALNAPKYVVKKDMENNTVTLGDNADLFSSSLVAKDFNWVSIEEPTEEIIATAKTRYHDKETKAKVKVNNDKTVEINFISPVRAITKGQAVVLYDGDVVLGGGTII